MNEIVGLLVLNIFMLLVFSIYYGIFCNNLNDELDELKEKLNTLDNKTDFDCIKNRVYDKKLTFDNEHKCEDKDLLSFWYELVKILYINEIGIKTFVDARIIPDVINCRILYHIEMFDKRMDTIPAENILFIATIDKKDNEDGKRL